MKSIRCFISSLLFGLILFGCTHEQDLKQGDSTPRIERLIEKQHYASALRAIRHLSAEDPAQKSVIKYRQQIDKGIGQYVKTTIVSADKLEAKNHWAEAKSTYQTTLKQIPDNRRLEKRFAAFELRRQKRLAILKLDLLVARGTWLSRYRKLYGTYKMTDTAFWATLSGPNKNEIERVASQLLAAGKKAMAEGTIRNAERTLPLAAILDPKLSADPAHSQLSKRLKRQKLAAQQLTRVKRKKAASRLRTEFAVALESRDLVAAKAHFKKLKPYLSKSETQQISDELQKKIEISVSKYLIEGDQLYREGEFRAALERWQRILTLDPDNKTAKTDIDRVNRVMEKLKQLKQKKTAASPDE